MKQIYILSLLLVLCIGGVTALVMTPGKETLTLKSFVQAREMKDASRFGGRVKDVLKQEGDDVRSGEAIVRFDNTELTSKVVQAQAALTQAKARESLLTEGADVSDIRQAYALVQQAEQHLRLLKSGGGAAISQADAQLRTAESLFDKAKAAHSSSPQMLAEGIISQQKFKNIQASFTEAQSLLNAAKEGLKQAKSGARQEQVNIAQSKLEASRAHYEKLVKGAKKEEIEIALATIDQAQSQLTSLEAQLAETEVKAKLPGSISILNLVSGDLVLPGQPIVSIIDYHDLWTDVYVPENKLYMVKLGEDVVVKASAFDKQRFRGRVAAINPKSEFVPTGQSSLSTEETSFRVKVKINRLDEKQRETLYPGMKVHVLFTHYN